MRVRARLELSYSSRKKARSIAESLKPDNIKVPAGMRVLTRCQGKSVITEIEVEGTIERMLSTLDDLLACAGTAEDVCTAR